MEHKAAKQATGGPLTDRLDRATAHPINYS